MADTPGPRRVLLRSAAFRLACLQATIFAAIVMILFGITWWTVGAYVEQRVHATAADELRELTHVLGSGPSGNTRLDLDDGKYYGLFDAEGRLLEGQITVLPVEPGDQPVRIASMGREPRLVHIVEGALPDGKRLVVGFDRGRADALLTRLRHAFLLACVLGVVAALAAGFITARRYLRSVEEIAAVAAQIATGRLETRLAVSHRDDEIDRLSAALNSTWQRSAALLEGMRQLSTDIAHELRTPLAHLRFRLEEARSSFDAGNPARAAMDRSIDDVDHVLAVFGALLRIAQIQTRHRRAGFGLLDLSQLAGAVVADYRPLVEDEGRPVNAGIQSGVEIIGDRTLLEQLLVNLIENALRHTPRGVALTVKLARVGDVVELSVADAGPGIPENQREKVLQRLVRLDSARATPGSGLGLALVQAIADLHDAPLRLEDAQPGLRVTIHFRPPG